MNQELTNKIIEKCPNLFSNLKEIEAPDGWFEIIKNASIVIEHILNTSSDLKSKVKAYQIKSKFGGLRFYVTHSSPYVDGVIALAEYMSYSICEECGSPGSQNSKGGWVATLCIIHTTKK